MLIELVSASLFSMALAVTLHIRLEARASGGITLASAVTLRETLTGAHR
jgi:hypothetical protein